MRTGLPTTARTSMPQCLAAVEAAQVRARMGGDFERAIRLGHDGLTVDPQADAIELELVQGIQGQ